MKICVIVPEQGGYSETFIRAHIEQLPGQVTYLYGGLFPTRRTDGSLLLPPAKFAERVRRSLLSRFFKMDFNEEKLKHQALVKFLKENQIDAVLAEYGPTGTRVMQACQDAAVALIVHFHGYDASEFETLQKYEREYREMFVKADAVVAVSQRMKAKLIELGANADKVFYCPCGMDSKIFYGAHPENAPPVFLSAGRFVDKKAPHLTLLAFIKVLERLPQARLVMVGQGELLDVCQSMARALKVESSVEFVKAKTHQEVAQLMRGVRAFVQHSRVALSGDSEGTPVAIQEAGGSGLPVVATDHAGIPDVVIDGVTGFIVPEEDIDAMAEAMIKLAQNPALAAQMGRAAREQVLSHFTLEKTIQRLSIIIETAVKNKRMV